jgi:Tol biopolymer transport system component
MTQHDDAQLATWLADGPAHGQPASLERALNAARATRQRPAWLVAVTGGTIGPERTNRSVGLAWGVVAVIALIGLLIGGLVVGNWLRPQPQPAPDAVLPSPSAEASFVPGGAGLIAYTVIEPLEPGVDCSDSFVTVSCFLPRLWVSNPDGTDAHELFPNREGRQGVAAWSPDGSQLLFSEDNRGSAGLMLTDGSGSEPQPLCDGPCSGFDGVVFSPDGSRLAFVRYGSEEGASVIATMDLATGVVTELESTRITDPEQGGNDAPRWSPDGTMLVFARQGITVPGEAEGRTVLLVVDADGSNLRQVAPTELHAIDPDWSPDGSRIVFISTVWNGADTDPLVIVNDIYTVRPDGTGVQRLTSDGASARPNWTADGRIVFAHLPPDVPAGNLAAAFELWIMNANGTNARRLDAGSAAELTAAGCITCPYPPPIEAELFFLNDAVWQPTR